MRALSQSGLYPSNCRLLDKREAALNAVTMPMGHTCLVVAFESADHPVRAWMERALELVADHGGSCPRGARLTGKRASVAGGSRWCRGMAGGIHRRTLSAQRHGEHGGRRGYL